MKKAPRSRHEAKAGVPEADLIQAFENLVGEDHPNLGRIGCPTKRELKQAASSPRGASQPILDHIAVCGPCLEQYDRFRRDAKAEMES
jgi:hypothetical protein